MTIKVNVFRHSYEKVLRGNPLLPEPIKIGEMRVCYLVEEELRKTVLELLRPHADGDKLIRADVNALSFFEEPNR